MAVQTPTTNIQSVLQEIIDNGAKLAKAFTDYQARLGSGERGSLSHPLETILDLFPRCIWALEELYKPQYEAESNRSPKFQRLHSAARTTLNNVVTQYTHVSTIECGLDLADTNSQLGVPTALMSALQVKACMNYLRTRKRERTRLRAREVAAALHDDIAFAAERLDSSVACSDLIERCQRLVYAIRSDTYWPQPYLGREADADLLLRLAHRVLCTPIRMDSITASIHTKVSRLRTLIIAFLKNDSKQTTPLISNQVSFYLPGSSVAPSPANTISSISSTLSMTPSAIAGWYFGSQNLASEIEVSGEVSGTGGFATVYKARWMGMDVAVKVIRGHAGENGGVTLSTLRKIKREKRMWGDMYHQYILPFFGVAEWNGQDALISPWVANNKSLEYFGHRYDSNRRRRKEVKDAVITKERIAQRLKFATEVACGILFLHTKNIVHGDIRMTNILLSQDGEPLITDFGLAKPTMSSFDTQPSTQFERSGSIRWMAPELHWYETAPERTKYSDVWAFACTILELFSGDVPYSEYTGDAEFYQKINEGVHPQIPEYLQKNAQLVALWKVLRGCWARNPKERPPMEVILTSLIMLRTDRTWMVDAIMSS